MSDREQLQRMCLLAMITLTIAGAAFALWVHWTEKETEAPEPYTVGEAEMVEPIPQAPVVAATQEVVCMEDAKPLLDPLCEDSYLMPDHPLSLEHQMLLYGACLEFQVDYALALAVVEQETRFRNVTGDDGDSVGFMQVQEKWHRERMTLLGVDDLKDPEGNFRVGCHFLRECIDKYGLERGLGYYNSGKAAVTSYSREVLGRMG